MTGPRPQAFEGIERALRGVRGRLRKRALLVFSGWSIAALGGVGLLASLVASSTGANDWGRAAVGLSLLAAFAGLAWFLAWRPLQRWRRDEAVAGHVEAGLPELQDGLVASVQFGREWSHLTAGSPQLVRELAERVARRLGDTDLNTLTSMEPARRPWQATLAVAVAWAIALAAAPGALRDGVNALLPVTAPGGLQRVGPLVGDLEITLHYPPHTAMKPRTIHNSSGDIEAIKGTRIALRATTLGAARSAVAVVGDPADGPRVPLELDGGRTVTGELVVEETVAWRFSVVDDDGDALVEAVERRIRMEPDRPPQVTLQIPESDMELEDLRRVEVAWEATDDFGLSKADVALALAVDADHPERIAQPGIEGRRAAAEDEIDLSVIDAQPGDRIALTVEVWDNNGVDGPQKGVSATRYITVHSPEAAHFELSDKLRDSIEDLLMALADRLEVEFRDPEPGPLTDRVHALTSVTEQAAMKLAEVVEAMAGDPLTPNEVRLALAGRLGQLEGSVSEEKTLTLRLAEGLAQSNDGAIRQVSKHNEVVVVHLEQTIVLVEAMVARLALEDLAAMTDQLKASRERLRELIEQYRDSPSDALKSRIMRDIQRLRDRIREMRDRMAQLRQNLPEEFLNIDGLKNDEVSDGLKETQDQLAELEKMLDEGKIDEALAALDEMSQALDELSGALDEDMNELHAETNPELQKAINELMDQARDLSRRQQELGNETETRAQAEAEALRKLLEEELGQKVEQVRRRAAELRSQVERIDPEHLPPYADDDLNNLAQRVDDMNSALERMALMEALEMAERSLDHIGALDRTARARPGGAERNRRTLMQAQSTDQSIIRDLSEILDRAQQQAEQRARQQARPQPGQPQPGQPQPGQPQQGGQQPGGQRMGEAQGQLAEATQRLQRRIAQSREGAVPHMSQEAEQQVERAADAMRQAAQRLDQGRPGQARPGQQQALSELEGVMQQLRQALQPQRAQRPQGQRGRRGVSREKVRIPGADEHEAPAEFRQELLDAMKDKAPERYQEQVKRYYESLVR